MFYHVLQQCSRQLQMTVSYAVFVSLLTTNILLHHQQYLKTQDEILLANLPPKWQLVCDNQIDRPIPLDSAIYTIVNRNDLCTCGISAQHIFLYESMHTCTTPDASVTLYYMHNKGTPCL